MPVEITLADGSKIIGNDAEEALKNAAKQLEDTKAAYREINTKFEGLNETVSQLQTAEEARRAEAQRAAAEAAARSKKDQTGFDNQHYIKLLNEDPLQAVEYANNFWMEKQFGAKPQDIAHQFTATTQTVTKLHQEAIAGQFAMMHPDFPVGDAVAAKALNVAVTQLTNQGYPFDVTTLDFAYQSLVREGKIKPMDLKDDDKHDPPPPNLNAGSGSGGNTANEPKWDEMDDKQLEAALRKAGALR